MPGRALHFCSGSLLFIIISDLLYSSGKVDWSAVKIQMAEAVEVAQKQLLAAANYVQLQLKQLVK